MKKQSLSLFFFLFAFIGYYNTANAQTRTTETADFVAAAGDTDDNMAMLLPAVQKVREAAAAIPVIEAARKLAAKVERSGAKMSKTQYEGYQRELAKLETDLNKILGNSTVPTSTSGSPKPGTSGECHQSCHDAFGNGFGGGKGWNRFWCKLGCFKVKVGPVEAGGN